MRKNLILSISNPTNEKMHKQDMLPLEQPKQKIYAEKK